MSYDIVFIKLEFGENLFWEMLKIDKNWKSYFLFLYFYYSEIILSKEGIKGFKLEVMLEYIWLKFYEVSSCIDVEEFFEKYEKFIEESLGKIYEGESFIVYFCCWVLWFW